MGLGLVIVVVVLFLFVALEDVFKDTYTNAKYRRDDEVMAAYRRAEDEYHHRRCLADIDRTVRETREEMARIAAEASGEIIEGTCKEIERL